MNRRQLTIGLVIVAVVLVVAITMVRRGGAGGDEGEIATDVAVHVASVADTTLHQYVTAYGYVAPEPASDGRKPAGAQLSPFVGGVLAGIDAVEGAKVTEGTVLFRLDSRMAEVAVQKAQQEVDFAEKAYQRLQTLVQSDGTSQKAYQEAQQRLDAAHNSLSAAQTDLAYLRIAAPLSGTVVKLNATVGQFVDAGTVLAEIVDLNRLVVAADVPSTEASALRAGQRVLVGPDSALIRGAVSVVGRDVSPATGTYRVLVSVPGGSHFMPGDFTQIRVIAVEHRNVLVVPEVSVVSRTGEGSWVMVVHGDSAVRTPVTAGLRDGGLVEVSGEGIAKGTSIVTDEAYSLPERTKIRIAGS